MILIYYIGIVSVESHKLTIYTILWIQLKYVCKNVIKVTYYVNQYFDNH